MPRAFVALIHDTETWIEILEDSGFEAVPITPDSVVDNIESLESCTVIFVDRYSPEWVMREIEEHHKLAVAVITTPPGPITAQVDTEQEFRDLLVHLKPIAGSLTPITPDFARRLATILALYPVRRTDAAK